MTAPYEIYSCLLFKEGQGYPLWNPALPARCPKEYKLTGIQVGDVGYLTPDGGFIFLFNISLSKDHPINKWRGVPDNFVPVDLGPIDVHYQSYPDFYPPKSVICYTEKGAKSIEGDVSATIPDPSGHSQVTVRASGGHQSSYSEAAALVLLNGASKDDYNCDLFGWAEKNVVHFYRYAITELGYKIPNGGLYLVTGVTNTDSWYISPFSEKSGGTYGSFEVGVKGVLSGGLSASTASSVTGSYAPRYSPPNHKGQNQSVFIRGWKMMIQSGLFRKLKPKMIDIHTATFSALRKVGSPPCFPGSIHETTMSSTTRRGEPHVGETTEGTTASSSTAGRREPRDVGEMREGTTYNDNVSSSRTRREEPLGGETREETTSTPNIYSSTTRREPHGGDGREGTEADKKKKPRKPSRERRSQSAGQGGPAGRKRDGPGGGAGGAGQSGGQGSGKNARGGGGGQADRDETKDNEGTFNSRGGKESVSGRQHGWGEKEIFSDDSESDDSRADPMLHPYHPSDVVNKYLLQMCPQSEVALTHDDIWTSIFQESDSVILDDEELLERINISYDIHESENKACVFVLRDGSETHCQSPNLEAVDSTIGHTSRDEFRPASQTKLYIKAPRLEELHFDLGGLRSFPCVFPGCGRSFGDLYNAQLHLLTHGVIPTTHSQFPCVFPGCGRSFGDLYNAQLHLLTHGVIPTTHSQSPTLGAFGTTIGHTSRDEFHTASQTLYTKEPGFEDNVALHVGLGGLRSFPCVFPGCRRSFGDQYNAQRHFNTHDVFPTSTPTVRRSNVHHRSSPSSSGTNASSISPVSFSGLNSSMSRLSPPSMATYKRQQHGDREACNEEQRNS